MGLTCILRICQPPQLLQGGETDPCWKYERAVKKQEINDVRCETTDHVLFVLKQCKTGTFFITTEN